MFKRIVLTLALTLMSATAALAANYIEPQELKVLLDKIHHIYIYFLVYLHKAHHSYAL